MHIRELEIKPPAYFWSTELTEECLSFLYFFFSAKPGKLSYLTTQKSNKNLRKTPSQLGLGHATKEESSPSRRCSTALRTIFFITFSLEWKGLKSSTTRGELQPWGMGMASVKWTVQKVSRLGKGSTEKKRFLSGIARITYLNPPHDPNSGNLVLLFRKSKFKIWKSV